MRVSSKSAGADGGDSGQLLHEAVVGRAARRTPRDAITVSGDGDFDKCSREPSGYSLVT